MSRPVTIIGGGLSGLTLGIGLRQRDIPVIIHEAGDYPRHRVCGEFISGRGQAVLERFGLLAQFEKAGAVYAKTAVFIAGTTQSPVRELAAPALCLSRHTMDALLAGVFQRLGGRLEAGSRWRSNTCGEGIVSATGRRLQHGEKGIHWFGVKAHIAKRSAVPLEADLEMHVFPHGYVGLSRIDSGQVNVCGLFRARPGKQPPATKTEWLLGPNGSRLRERLKGAQFDPQSLCSVAGLPLNPQRAGTKKECCIGDALTMTPPVTGNGMSMAYESAAIAVEPLAAYSRGELGWEETRHQIAMQCDGAFLRRLTWARVLQWMMVARATQYGPGKFLLRSHRLWQFMFARTR